MKTAWPRDIASARMGTASARVERRGPAPSHVRRWVVRAAAVGVLAIAVLIAGATRWMAHSPPLAASPSVAPGNSPAPTRVDRSLPEQLAAATGGAALRWSGRVQSEAGQALPGARVCAAPDTADLSAKPACATTDAAGRFALSAPASTLLCASLAGYLPLSQRVTESSSGRPLVLVLRPGGVRVSGDVVDASGGPIAGATLRALRSPSEPLALAVSDTAGRFELTVAPGLVRIDVEADGYSQLAREIRAPLGGVRFALSVESAIVGRVLGDDSELPWAGATVTAVEQSAPGAEPWSVLSAADGSFRFASLPAGRYELVAVSERGRSAPSALTLGVAQVSDPVELRVLAATRLVGSVRVDEAPCERGSVVLQGPVAAYAPLAADGSVAFDGLWPGQYRIQASCEGARSLEESLELGLTPMSVVWELERGLALRGRALTAEGAPLALASIDVWPVERGEGLTSVSCPTDELGHFSCGGLSPGAYECTIGPGVPPRSEPVRVQMLGGETPEIVLHARPLGELHVHVAPAGRFELPALAMIAQSDQTTLAGELRDDVFVFEALPLGSYVISTDPSLGREARRVEITRSGQVAELTLELPAPHALSGRVADDQGHGVPDAWVRATRRTEVAPTRASSPVLTSAEGTFSLEGLLPGTYTLSVSAEHGEAELAGVASDSRNVEVRVPAHGSLSGSVLTAQGEPAQDFVVAYRALGGDSEHEVRGVRGSWSARLPPGTYQLTARAAQGSAIQTVQLLPRQELSVELLLASSPPGSDPSASSNAGAGQP